MTRGDVSIQTRHNDQPTQAYVTDRTVVGMRSVFIRLAPRGATSTDTIRADHCDVDLDAAGNVIGVTFILLDPKPQREP
jgi:hypothetical protein